MTDQLTPPKAGHSLLVLLTIASATLMIVLDASIINIALPRAQSDLALSDVARPWIITAYALSFGGLLLLGGRIADTFGHRRMFLLGLAGFALASAFGGFASSGTALILARALQGMFGAVLAPAALALLTTTFTAPEERARAFAVYGAVQGLGGAVGLLLGGALTEFLGWRWCFFINLPIALAVGLAALKSIPPGSARKPGNLDLIGAVLSVTGLTTLVYGLTVAGEGNTAGTHRALPLVAILAGVGVLALFALHQRAARHPLLPLSIPMERSRGAAFLSLLLIGAGMFGMLMFLAYYLQVVLGFSPLQTGLAFLPFSGGIILGSSLASHLMPRLGDGRTMWIGLLGASIGMVWLTPVGIGPGFAQQVLPALCVMSLGLGVYFVPASSSALKGVPEAQSGVASALVNVTQQVGGAIGPALLNTIFLFATQADPENRLQVPDGYRAAFVAAAVLFVLALIIALLLPRSARTASAGSKAR
ncbi:DHA2 family efflux MFS transporter permease subunit [Marinibacterium sp. SX1]|uniref:DHA2 family efflux MFS transporter permease subunit n=1 Tax=Marinibacterium sp. SX1 TaxID=3388424 RepID=UPI003D175D57